MKNPASFAFKFSILAGTGLSGWYAGKYFDKQQQLNNEKDSRNVLSNVNIKQRPGLPIFGTVSAASPILPAENSANMGGKLSTVGRVSEVPIHSHPT